MFFLQLVPSHSCLNKTQQHSQRIQSFLRFTRFFPQHPESSGSAAPAPAPCEPKGCKCQEDPGVAFSLSDSQGPIHILLLQRWLAFQALYPSQPVITAPSISPLNPSKHPAQQRKSFSHRLHREHVSGEEGSACSHLSPLLQGFQQVLPQQSCPCLEVPAWDMQTPGTNCYSTALRPKLTLRGIPRSTNSNLSNCRGGKYSTGHLGSHRAPNT